MNAASRRERSGSGALRHSGSAPSLLHWNGRRWSLVPTPTIPVVENPNEGVLYGVSASSTSDAWAVGFGFVTPGTHTLRYGIR